MQTPAPQTGLIDSQKAQNQLQNNPAAGFESAAKVGAAAMSAAQGAGMPAIAATATMNLYGVHVPALGPGVQTTEFVLSLAVLAAILAALWCGKMDAGLASALLGLVATAYPGLRTWLKAQHLNSVAQVLATQQGAHADVFHAAAAALAAVDSTDAAADAAASPADAPTPHPAPVCQPIPGSGAGGTSQQSTTDSLATGSLSAGHVSAGAQAGLTYWPLLAGIASVCALCLLGALLTGCTSTPYYVSGVDASVTTGPDGQSVTGGAVGVSFAPNPQFAPAPVNPAPAKSGTAGVKASTVTIPIAIPKSTPTPTSANEMGRNCGKTELAECSGAWSSFTHESSGASDFKLLAMQGGVVAR